MHRLRGRARQGHQVCERRWGRPGSQPANRGIAEARVAGLGGLEQRRQRAVVADGAHEPDERAAGGGSLDRFQLLEHRAQVRSVRSSEHGAHGPLGIVSVFVGNAKQQFEQRRRVRSPRQTAQRLPRFLADRPIRRFRRFFESRHRAHRVAGRKDADQLRLPTGVVLDEKAGQHLVDPRSPQMDETLPRRLAFGGWYTSTGPVEQRLDGSLVAKSAQGLDRRETDCWVFAGHGRLDRPARGHVSASRQGAQQQRLNRARGPGHAMRQLFRRGCPGQLRHQLQSHALECGIAAGQGSAHGADALLRVRADCPPQRCHPHLCRFAGPGQWVVQRRRDCILALSEQLVGAGQKGGGDLRSRTALRAGERLLQSFDRSTPIDPAQRVGCCPGYGLIGTREQRDQRLNGRAITARCQRADHAEPGLAIQRPQGVPQHLINGRAGNAFECEQRGVRRKLLVSKKAVHGRGVLLRGNVAELSADKTLGCGRRDRRRQQCHHPIRQIAAKSLEVVSSQAVGIHDQLLKRGQRLPFVAESVTRDGAQGRVRVDAGGRHSGWCRRPDDGRRQRDLAGRRPFRAAQQQRPKAGPHRRDVMAEHKVDSTSPAQLGADQHRFVPAGARLCLGGERLEDDMQRLLGHLDHLMVQFIRRIEIGETLRDGMCPILDRYFEGVVGPVRRMIGLPRQGDQLLEFRPALERAGGRVKHHKSSAFPHEVEKRCLRFRRPTAPGFGVRCPITHEHVVAGKSGCVQARRILRYVHRPEPGAVGEHLLDHRRRAPPIVVVQAAEDQHSQLRRFAGWKGALGHHPRHEDGQSQRHRTAERGAPWLLPGIGQVSFLSVAPNTDGNSLFRGVQGCTNGRGRSKQKAEIQERCGYRKPHPPCGFLQRGSSQLHFSKKMATPWLIAPKSGSPRNSGVAFKPESWNWRSYVDAIFRGLGSGFPTTPR